MKADISIRRVGNVWLVKTPSGLGDRVVVDAIPTDQPVSLFAIVRYALDLAGSRYAAKRVTVTMQPGDKHHDVHPKPCADCECGCDPDRSTKEEEA